MARFCGRHHADYRLDMRCPANETRPWSSTAEDIVCEDGQTDINKRASRGTRGKSQSVVLTASNGIGWMVGVLFLCSMRVVLGVGTTSVKGSSCSSDVMDSCLHKISGALLDSNSTKGIPASQQELNDMCQIFDDGMKCLDDFSSSCLKAEHKQLYEQQVSGAREVMQRLCEDNSVRKEFLNHSDCFKRLNNEWEKCAAPLADIVNKDIGAGSVQDREEEAKKICRARHEFQRCIQLVTDRLCDPDAAQMLQTFANMLIENPKHQQPHVNQCQVTATRQPINTTADEGATSNGDVIDGSLRKEDGGESVVGHSRESQRAKPAANVTTNHRLDHVLNLICAIAIGYSFRRQSFGIQSR